MHVTNNLNRKELALDCSSGDTLCDLLAEHEVESQHRDKADHQGCKLLTEVGRKCACELLDTDGKGFVLVVTGKDVDEQTLLEQNQITFSALQ